MLRDSDACSIRWGATSLASTLHAWGSRKKLVTLIRIVLNSATCSSAWRSRYSAYRSKLSTRTCCIRALMRRASEARLYSRKSKLYSLLSFSSRRANPVSVTTSSGASSPTSSASLMGHLHLLRGARPHELNDGRTDLLERQTIVDAAGGERRLRHSRMRRSGRILDDRGPADPLDGLDAGGAVDAGAGQHDPDRAVAVGPGDGLEEQVDRGAGEMHELRMAQLEPPIGDEQVHVGRRDVDRPGADGLVVDRLLHGQARPPAEQVGEHALVPRIEVLDDEDSRCEARGQGSDDLVKRLDASGRGADGDGIEESGSGSWHRSPGFWKWEQPAHAPGLAP